MTTRTEPIDLADKRRIQAFQKFCGSWATGRDEPWIFAGWIARTHPGPRVSGELTFEQFVERERQSDHGETREVDLYPEGGVCWYREVK